MSKKQTTKSKRQKAAFRQTNQSVKKTVAQSGGLAAVKVESIVLLFILAAISMIIIVGPFKRGLFFQEELLPVHIISFGLFILWWVCKLIRKDGSFLKSPLDCSVFALVLFYFLSFSFTAVNKRAALEELLKVANYFTIYLLVLDICKKKDLFSFLLKPETERPQQDVRQAKSKPEPASDGINPGLVILLHALAVSGLAVALGGIGAAAGTWDIYGAYIDGRIFSSLQYPNTTAAYLTASFFLALGLSRLVKDKNWYIRPLYLAGSTVIFITLILTYSRGAWLLLPFLSILFLALIDRGERLRMALYIFLTLLATLPFIQQLDTALRTGESGEAWKYVLLTVLISIVGGSLIELVSRLNVKFKLVFAGAALALAIIFSFLALLPNLTDPLHPENTPVQTPGTELKGNISQEPLSFLDKLLPAAVYDRIVTIRSGDESIEGRFNFYKDALKIIKDYPLLGAGGGGWKTLYFSYQSSRYFTTEVHNHFLQVWIESGFLGFLSFLSIWVFFILAFLRNHLNPLIRLNHKKAWVASFIPAIALGAHSAFDFNLSLGAVSIFLFALLAAGSSLDTGENYFSSALFKKINLPGKPWSSCLIGLFLSLILFFLSFSLWEGYKIGIAAERKAAEKDFGKAMELFESAVKKDPYKAMNHVNLARIYEHLAVFKENEENALKLNEQAYLSFKKALSLEPYNTSFNLDMARILLARGQIQEGLSYINRAIELKPYDAGVFIQAAKAHLAVAEHYLSTNDRKNAEEILQIVLLLEGRMAEYHDNTAAIAYYLGQAAFLLEDYEKAAHCFTQVVLEDENYLRSQVYLAVLFEKKGEDKLAEEIKGSFSENEEMMALYEKLTNCFNNGR